MRSFNGCMKCTRVLRRVTSGAFKYCLANSCARLSALPFGTTSATTPHCVRDSRRKRLWVQQKRLSSTCPGAIAPRREDSIPGHNTPGEVGHIVESGAFRRHNHAGEQRVFGVHMGASFNSRNHWHAYVGNVLDNLNTFVMDLAPNAGIGDVAEGRKIDTGNELPACSRQDHDLIRAILRDPVESVDQLGVILRCESEWPALV